MSSNRNLIVSVIIPNYCHSRYLDQRIQSVLNQTYQDFEVIILDDCSPDNGASKAVIEKYREDSHISQIVYNEENSGNTFKQWDKGIALAKGDVIWIAESDDFCEPILLEELVKAYTQRENIVMAFAPVVFTTEAGKPIGYYSEEGRTQFIRSRDFITKYLTVDNCVQNASCCIFSKEVALSIDRRYTKYRGIGDWWFWFEMAEKGDVVIVNKHLSYFRRHEGTVTEQRIADGSNLVDEKEFLEHIASKFSMPKWRWDYIYHRHADSKRNLPFNTEEIRNRMAEMWNFDKRYSLWERFVYRLINHISQKYLYRI